MKLSWPIAFIVTAALAAGCVDGVSRDRWEDILGGGGVLGRWQTLGRSEADSPNDRDSITVSRDAGRVRQLRVEVRGGSIELNEMVVTLDDGTAFRPNIGQRLDERSPSPDHRSSPRQQGHPKG